MSDRPRQLLAPESMHRPTSWSPAARHEIDVLWVEHASSLDAMRAAAAEGTMVAPEGETRR
jgi:hypothetical protein